MKDKQLEDIFEEMLPYGLVIGVLSFMLSSAYFIMVFSLPRIDNPSSTDSIAYIFVFLFSVFVGLVGVLAGLLLGTIS